MGTRDTQGMLSRPDWAEFTVWRTTCWLDRSTGHWRVAMTEVDEKGAVYGDATFRRVEFNEWQVLAGLDWHDVDDVGMTRRLEAIVQSTSDLNAMVAGAGR